MKDKVKRRRILNQRKIRDIYKRVNYSSSSVDVNNDLNIERQRQLIEQQQNEYDNLMVMRLKLKLMRKKAKELNHLIWKQSAMIIKQSKSFEQITKIVRKKDKK